MRDCHQAILTLVRLCQATLPEVLGLIEREQLHGLGCGVVDVMLLAPTRLTAGARLWTPGKRLAALAQRFGVSHR